MSEPTNFKWYVLRAISGKESKVKEYIDAEVKNSDLGQYVNQVLIPTEKVYQIRNGKKITKERSCMPGYVLIEANLIGETPHRLRNTPNVLGFLGERNNVPTPIRTSEINRILGTMDELQETGEEMITPYFVGENVKVVFRSVQRIQRCYRRGEQRKEKTQSYGYDIRTENSARIRVYPS